MYKKNKKVIKHNGREFKKTTLQKIVDKPDDVELLDLIQVYVPDSFVLIVSPNDDIVAAYGLQMINMNLKTKDGKKMNLTKKLFSTDENDIENGKASTAYEQTVNEFIMHMMKIIWRIATEVKKVVKERKTPKTKKKVNKVKK